LIAVSLFLNHMQVSVAVQALTEKKLPFISVLCDPTFGGVSASYAMQADVRIAVTPAPKNGATSSEEARIGFAGPAVILNTMCEGNQARFDEQCPADFQGASFVRDCGQIDMVLEGDQAEVEKAVAGIARLLTANLARASNDADVKDSMLQTLRTASSEVAVEASSADSADHTFNYTRSRLIDRPQTQDILQSLFSAFVELSGDGKVGRDNCLRGGVGMFRGIACLGLGTYKGHTPTDMQNANYGKSLYIL
jgi:hypothetical protein